MAEPATLTTARLTLVPFAERHLTQAYVDWLNDKALMRYSEQRHRHHSLESCRAYWESFAGTPHVFWAVEATADGLGHVGNITVTVDPRNEVADVAILIGAAAARGRRYGLEAWRAVLTHLIADRGLRKVTAGTLAINQGMRAILRDAGMVEDGCQRRQFLVDGQEVDVVYAATFRNPAP